MSLGAPVLLSESFGHRWCNKRASPAAAEWVVRPVQGDATLPVDIPAQFQRVPYDPARHPQSAEFDPTQGANCQLWAYALLKHFGIDVPRFRSSDLWDDQHFSDAVWEPEPLDLLLFNDTDRAWGAHVAVYLGDGVVTHLSREIGFPEVCSLENMLRNPKYRVLVGVKRMKAPGTPMQPTAAGDPRD